MSQSQTLPNRTLDLERQKDLLAKIDRFAEHSPLSVGRKEVVDDLIQLQLNTMSALAPLVYSSDCVWFRPDCLVALDKYRPHPQAWKDLVQLGVELTNLIAWSEPFTDHLGDFYTEALAPASATQLGQFLTPWSLASSMADFVAPASEPQASKPELSSEPAAPFHLGDPTCGAGALVLARLAHTVKTEGRAALGRIDVLLNDIDLGMAKLAAVQIGFASLLHRAPLAGLSVYCGDIITDYIDKEALIVRFCAPGSPTPSR